MGRVFVAVGIIPPPERKTLTRAKNKPLTRDKKKRGKPSGSPFFAFVLLFAFGLSTLARFGACMLSARLEIYAILAGVNRLIFHC